MHKFEFIHLRVNQTRRWCIRYTILHTKMSETCLWRFFISKDILINRMIDRQKKRKCSVILGFFHLELEWVIPWLAKMSLEIIKPRLSTIVHFSWLKNCLFSLPKCDVFEWLSLVFVKSLLSLIDKVKCYDLVIYSCDPRS